MVIMDIEELRTSIEEAFADAQDSRSRGKEGRARVSARRAAGLAIANFYRSRLGKSPPRSALQLLQWFSRQETVPNELRQAASRLTVRVTPAFKLPHPEDPLEDATMLIEAILGGDD
jgi:HEPN domain-containing protein